MPEYLGGIPPEDIGSSEEGENLENEFDYDTIIILGAGTRPNHRGEMTGLTFDSKLRVLAGGLIAREGKAKQIILTGGKTAGPENPSEAEVMKTYLLKKYPQLDESTIITEDASFNTIENSRHVAKLLGESGDKLILLVTNDYHLLRASKNFENQGVIVAEIPAENIVSSRSKSHEQLIQRYLGSCEIKKKRSIEAILRGITAIDPEGKLLTALARVLRHGNIGDEPN